MHPVLLIDEILRHIFLFCSYHDRASLVSAAQSCKAWKDPALDCIWYRLPSIEPLLFLLRGDALSVEGVLIDKPDMGVFQSYAQRVKHIAHRQEVEKKLLSAACLHLTQPTGVALPNLSTAYLSFPKCPTSLMSLYISHKLRYFDADLGFKFGESSNKMAFCDFMEQILVGCPELRGLSLRGISSPRLNDIISSMRTLKKLSLKLGQSLIADTLHAILTFPHLSELEIHAGHVVLDDLDDLETQYMEVLFPSLRKLCIRAKSNLVENILRRIQPNTLHHLHIELDDPSPSTASWNTILRSVCDKAVSSLHYLRIEHHFENPEILISSPLDVAQTSNAPQGSIISSITFDDIQNLSGLKQLHYFACDLSLPPLLCDKDIADLATWWPDLEHLELGSAYQGDETELRGTWNAQITLASLTAIATKLPKLEKLMLPLRIGGSPLPPPASNVLVANKLRSLTIAHLGSCQPLQLAKYLHQLFPLLEEFEGPSDDTRPWIDTKAALAKLFTARFF